MDSYGAAFPQVQQQVQQAADQTPQLAAQSLGIQGPTPNQAGDFIDQARQAAQAAGIDPDIFARQINQESGFNPSAKSGAGAIGIAQFMPGTAAGMGIDPTDPVASLKAAAQMDAQNLQKYGGDWGEALAAYNAGGGNVDKYGGIPPFAETQSYVNNILGGAKNVVQNAASTGRHGDQRRRPGSPVRGRAHLAVRARSELRRRHGVLRPGGSARLRADLRPQPDRGRG